MSNLNSLWQEFVEDLRKKRPSKIIRVGTVEEDSAGPYSKDEEIEVVDLEALFKAMDAFGDKLRRRLNK